MNAGEPITTLEDLRKVISAPSTVYPDGLAPWAVIGFTMFVEDYLTVANLDAPFGERIEASISMFNLPGKVKKVKSGRSHEGSR